MGRKRNKYSHVALFSFRLAWRRVVADGLATDDVVVTLTCQILL